MLYATPSSSPSTAPAHPLSTKPTLTNSSHPDKTLDIKHTPPTAKGKVKARGRGRVGARVKARVKARGRVDTTTRGGMATDQGNIPLACRGTG